MMILCPGDAWHALWTVLNFDLKLNIDYWGTDIVILPIVSRWRYFGLAYIVPVFSVTWRVTVRTRRWHDSTVLTWPTIRFPRFPFEEPCQWSVLPHPPWFKRLVSHPNEVVLPAMKMVPHEHPFAAVPDVYHVTTVCKPITLRSCIIPAAAASRVVKEVTVWLVFNPTTLAA